jgi:centractin
MIGFGQRVKNELERLAVKGTKIKIFAPPERKYTTWIGGSILAALGTFRKVYVLILLANEKMWVSAEEYQEDPEVQLSYVYIANLDYPSQGNLGSAI